MAASEEIQKERCLQADDLGPLKILQLHDAKCGLDAIVVVDNIALGPAIGGVRMVEDVTVGEVARLARTMTLKNAAAGLGHGGAKAGIAADPCTPHKESLVRSFARGIAELLEYVPAPDMGTDESSMAAIREEIGRSVGLPRSLGGIPLDQIGATGFGVAECAEVAAARIDLALEGARLAVEGFGHVGEHAARFLTRKGAKLVAASDINGMFYDPAGIDVEDLASAKGRAGTIMASDIGAERRAREAIFSVPCDIFIPAARPDTLDRERALALKAKLVVEGANIPTTAEAERVLFERGILAIPDFIANAGGVICCSVEYHGGSEADAFGAIKEKIIQNTSELLTGLDGGTPPRQVALQLAVGRVRAAMARQASSFIAAAAGRATAPAARRRAWG